MNRPPGYEHILQMLCETLVEELIEDLDGVVAAEEFERPGWRIVRAPGNEVHLHVDDLDSFATATRYEDDGKIPAFTHPNTATVKPYGRLVGTTDYDRLRIGFDLDERTFVVFVNPLTPAREA